MLKAIFTAIKNIFRIKKIIIALIIFWILFSIGYIARDQWLKMQIRQLQVGYQQGIADSVRAMMNQSAECKPISLVEGDKKIEVIAVDCLQKTQN